MRAIRPRYRVISDNDYCGDPDGLVHLAHHLLSPSVDMRCVIGGQVPTYDPSWSPTCASDSEAAARHVALLADRNDVRVLPGASEALSSPSEPRCTAAAEAIVSEALREDTDAPLMVVCGGSLTNIASAWLMEPRIASRLTLVWIGGHEYRDLSEPGPGSLAVEYNTSIDIIAAQVVFNVSDLPLWQVPRNVYEQVLASMSELSFRMRPCGPLGQHLFESLERTAGVLQSFGIAVGETYVLGDSPLVLLTGLLSTFDPRPTSSEWVDRPRYHVLDTGQYESSRIGPPLRVFTRLDTRVLLEDLYAKLALRAQETPQTTEA
ncbi:MAG: nucleoside hydrolase [Acidimicrobiales bacterium]